MKNRPNEKKGKAGLLISVLLSLLIVVSFVLFFAVKWYVTVYGRMGFDAVLYTLTNNLGGVQSDLVRSFMESVLPKTVGWSCLVCGILFFSAKKKIVLTLCGKLRLRLFPFRRGVAWLVSLALCIGLLSYAAVDVELVDYLVNLYQVSGLYEKEYRDPSEVTITFPKEKRNLIYIFMESMETTFFSREQGGALDENVIPELYELGETYINFSQNKAVGGFAYTPGAQWTIGAMTAQTSGVPLKLPPGIDSNDYGQDGVFLPGLTTLGDILHENGYYQALMVGSDANFGGRYQYYTQHHTDQVYDLYTAREDGIIPEDYYEWWGMEDKYLYEYAKQALTDLAAKDQPFAFTMLTVDTHHIGGYVCEYCENTREEQYENVFACASRQLYAFVQWLQQQDFYEDTAIVIAGDHFTMDYDYIQRIEADCDRRSYNCFINSAVKPVISKGREFSTMDMFPTTLAAMGCTIKGDRLGLGTNLFSMKRTLCEKMGPEEFFSEIEKSSEYYMIEFLEITE